MRKVQRREREREKEIRENAVRSRPSRDFFATRSVAEALERSISAIDIHAPLHLLSSDSAHELIKVILKRLRSILLIDSERCEGEREKRRKNEKR